MSSGVKKLAQVVVGAVIGFVQGGPWGAAAGAALAFYAAEQQEKLNTKSPLRDNEPSAQTVRSSKAPVRFILGRVSTGGVLVWAQEQTGEQANGEWLHLVYVLCEGSVDALENIYLGEEEIGSFGEFASYELIVNPTAVNAFLEANCPDWKDTQIGRGLSFVRVSLKYSAEKFPSGIPDTRFVVRGRNDIYDPRTGANVYTDNTALHILWFLRARCGVPDDEIVFETFASAANVCDEALTNADDSTSQRYRTSCVIGADEQRPGVLQKLEAACSGKLIRVGGRWMLQAGAYYGPYDFEITEDMVIGTVAGSTEPTNDNAINTVRGTFIDPTQSWTETDYPEVSIAEWVVEDGGEAAETLTFSYVTDPYQAQRLANIELRRRRAGGTISIPMNFAGYNCRPGRVIRVNLPSLNIMGEFIVTNWSMGDNEGCTVQVSQYEPAIFDDAVGQPYDPIGFISLPAGGLGSPAGLAWAMDETAEVVQGVLSWTKPSGIVTSYLVTIRQGTNVVQSHSVPETATQVAINGLPSGSYTMSVAAIGPMARSGEASIGVNISGPPIPEACVVQSSIDSITLIPSNTATGLNGGTYEYFLSATPQGQPQDAAYLGQGLSFTHTGLSFYANYYYFVRSSNAYGKSGFLYVPASTSNDVTAYLDALTGQLGETQLGKELFDRINLIDAPGNVLGSVNERLQAAKELSDELLANLETQLGEVNEELQGQIDQIEDLADSAGWKDDRPYTSGQSVIFTDGFLYQATKDVPVNTPPPNTDYWLNVGQAVSAANGLAARTQTIETKVTEIEGVNTTQASQITGLRTDVDGKASGTAVSSLTQRVTTAEGSIASQGTALTGLSNTVAGKADAQALTALTTRVTSAEGVNNSQGTAITSLNNSLAAKANSSTVTSLSNTVSEQGADLTAQGNALTNIKANLSGIRGDSINLIPDTYSWLGATLPTIAVSSTAVATSVDASVPSGNRFRVVRGEVAQPWIMMAASNNAAGWNVTLKAGTYLLSFWANTNGAGITNGLTLRAAFWDGSSRSPTDFRLTGDRVRYTAVITVTAESQGAAVFFVPAGAAGDVFWIDSVMIEARVGTSNVPSAFVSGPSITSAANAAAISLLNAAVTRQGQDITSASQAVTQLSSSIGGTGVNLLPDTYSWIASAALPAIGLTAGLSLSGLSGEAGSVAGGAIRIQTTDTNTNRQFMLIPVNSDANGRNIPVEPGTYLVSFFAYSNQNVTLRAGLWDSTGARLGATKVIGTARVRHTFVVTITVAGMAAVIVYPSTDGVSGVPTVYYSFMVEKQIGGSIVPSPFTPGSSASSVTSQASAISATQTTVAQQGTTITSMSSRIDSVSSSAGTANTTAQQALTATATTDGKLSAMLSVKLGVTSNGIYYQTGYGLGIENGPAGVQSTFAVQADKFIVLNGTGSATAASPFSISGGQVFLGSTFIQDGTITNAKIGSFISSTNYVAGQQGWILNKNGTLEINGVVSGGGRLVLTNRSVRVFDANGVKRVQLGDLTE